MSDENIGLIYKVAHELIKKDELCRKVIGKTVSEYLGVGYIALQKAKRNFDLSKNYKFSTYACKVIRDQIIKYARKNSTLIKIASSYRYQAWRVCNGKPQTSGSEKGIKAVFKILEKKMEKILPNAKITKEESNSDNYEFIHKHINSLDSRIRQVIVLRYGLYNNEPKTLQEIGDCLNPKISKERVRQLEKEGLQKLQNILSYS